MGRPKRARDLTIIIPAAGLGRRMKSYGPKSLIDISGASVIERQLSVLRSVYPRADIVVVLGCDADRIIKHIQRFRIKIVENELYNETSVARSIGMGLRVADHSNILLVYGDLVFNNATVTNITNIGSCIVVDKQGLIDSDEVGVNVVEGKVTHFGYGIDTKWAQITYLTNRELALFKQIVWHPDNCRYLGYEILNKVVDAGGRLRAVEPAGMQLVEIDSSKDIEKARLIIDENTLSRRNSKEAVHGRRLAAGVRGRRT